MTTTEASAKNAAEPPLSAEPMYISMDLNEYLALRGRLAQIQGSLEFYARDARLKSPRAFGPNPKAATSGFEYCEIPLWAVRQLIAIAQGIEAEGRDPKGLGAKPESPVAESDAPKPSGGES